MQLFYWHILCFCWCIMYTISWSYFSFIVFYQQSINIILSGKKTTTTRSWNVCWCIVWYQICCQGGNIIWSRWNENTLRSCNVCECKTLYWIFCPLIISSTMHIIWSRRILILFFFMFFYHVQQTSHREHDCRCGRKCWRGLQFTFCWWCSPCPLHLSIRTRQDEVNRLEWNHQGKGIQHSREESISETMTWARSLCRGTNSFTRGNSITA